MKEPWFECVMCGAEHPLTEMYRCPEDGGELKIVYDYQGIRKEGTFVQTWKQPLGMWERFWDLLPQHILECQNLWEVQSF